MTNNAQNNKKITMKYLHRINIQMQTAKETTGEKEIERKKERERKSR